MEDLYAIPLGVDAPRAIINGLLQRYKNRPPQDLARVTLIVNTTRMKRRLEQLLRDNAALLHPRLLTLEELEHLAPLTQITAPSDNLARRFELIAMIGRLLQAQPDLAPRASLFDLADSLAALTAEMLSESVDPQKLYTLDIQDQSGHWQRSLQFLRIISDVIDPALLAQSAEGRFAAVIAALAENWAIMPPRNPVILAGSTGSRGATLALMRLVAAQKLGAVIVPGVDTSLGAQDWQDIAKNSEDHPQYRIAMLRTALSQDQHAAWTNWHEHAAVIAPERQKLISLALCPAPVTDRWRAEGPKLSDLSKACAGLTLLETPSERIEALCIALRARDAVAQDQTVAIITPNRNLTRRITAILDQWGITPDDSAGTPLHLTPPGRFLRLVSQLFVQDTVPSALFALLKHPLTHSGPGRNKHLLWSREYELYLRKKGVLVFEPQAIENWAYLKSEDETIAWAQWVGTFFFGQNIPENLSLEEWLTQLQRLAENIAEGSQGETGASGVLWDQAAGRKMRQVFLAMCDAAPLAGEMSRQEFYDLFNAALSREELRERDNPHPLVKIWGTLEARVHGADLLILAGLNEGSWPEMPAPDPWLNRAMRRALGLLSPERQIGLSAHDFQQALAMPYVWLTRSLRDSEAETVPSRWLNRLENLLNGLEKQGGCRAFDEMRLRGQDWLRLAQRFEDFDPVKPAARPAPMPPATGRLTSLSVTQVKTLIRDPYAIYARHILKLSPLAPIDPQPDPLLRGVILHEIYEDFVKNWEERSEIHHREVFFNIAQDHLAAIPWAAARLSWLAMLEASIDWFIAGEIKRRKAAIPQLFEHRGIANIPELGITLKAKADRIDIAPDGRVALYDYKTGTPPSEKVQRLFDKQLLIEAAMIFQSGFGELPPREVFHAAYLGLGRRPTEIKAPIAQETPRAVWQGLLRLLTQYAKAEQGFTARRALQSEQDISEYDHLARFGEWDITDMPMPMKVGDHA